MFQIASGYPADAANGADFLSLAAQRDIDDGDGKLRPERVVVFDRYLDNEDVLLLGRVCVSETTIRMVAADLEMVDRVTVDRLTRNAQRVQSENDQLAAENLALKAALDGLQDTQMVRTVYVAPDGSPHATARLAQEHA
jgi:hypothetical protein